MNNDNGQQCLAFYDSIKMLLRFVVREEREIWGRERKRVIFVFIFYITRIMCLSVAVLIADRSFPFPTPSG